MPRPRYRRRVDLNKLNPYDAHDMDTINREWRRMQARKVGRDVRRGWFRVVLFLAGCALLGAAVATALFILVQILRSL